MCVILCLFSALSRRVGALQVSIITIIIPVTGTNRTASETVGTFCHHMMMTRVTKRAGSASTLTFCHLGDIIYRGDRRCRNAAVKMRGADQGSENNALTLILSQFDTLMSHSRILSTFSAEDWTVSKCHFASYCLTAVTYCMASVL